MFIINLEVINDTGDDRLINHKPLRKYVILQIRTHAHAHDLRRPYRYPLGTWGCGRGESKISKS